MIIHGGAFVKSLIDFRDSALYGHIGHLICRKVKSSDTECWVFILYDASIEIASEALF